MAHCLGHDRAPLCRQHVHRRSRHLGNPGAIYRSRLPYLVRRSFHVGLGPLPQGALQPVDAGSADTGKHPLRRPHPLWTSRSLGIEPSRSSLLPPAPGTHSLLAARVQSPASLGDGPAVQLSGGLPADLPASSRQRRRPGAECLAVHRLLRLLHPLPICQPARHRRRFYHHRRIPRLGIGLCRVAGHRIRFATGSDRERGLEPTQIRRSRGHDPSAAGRSD